jgi:hypothetical protein
MSRDLLNQEDVILLLAALGIEEIRFSLNGGGDNGDAEVDAIEWLASYPDGSPVHPVPLGQIPHVEGSLESVLLNSVGEWPDFDWVNNEGGFGTITVRPFEQDMPVDIDMNYNEESEGDFDEEDEELAEDLELEGDSGPAAHEALAAPDAMDVSVMDVSVADDEPETERVMARRR